MSMMRRRLKREQDRLKIDMQFQVHTADDDQVLRGRRVYPAWVASPTSRKIMFKDKKISETASLPSSLIETSTEGMDSEEGQQLSRKLYKCIDQLGLSKGRSSIVPYVRAKKGLDRLTGKKGIVRTLKLPKGDTQPEVTEGEMEVRPQIVDVLEYQEQMEIGSGGVQVHPPKLVEGLLDDGLRNKMGELLQPQPKLSIYSLAEQLRQGIQPRIGRNPIEFVPYSGNTEHDRESGHTPGYDLYLPIGVGLAVTQMMAWQMPTPSPEGNEMVGVMIELWQDKYGTALYHIDTVTSQVYISSNGGYEPIDEKFVFKPIVGTEVVSTTPIGGLGMGRLIVETPGPTLLADQPLCPQSRPENSKIESRTLIWGKVFLP